MEILDGLLLGVVCGYFLKMLWPDPERDRISLRAAECDRLSAKVNELQAEIRRLKQRSEEPESARSKKQSF